MVERAFRSGALDRLAIGLSGLCLIHCLASILLVATLASAGGGLLDEALHETGLAIAIVLGLVAIGWGFREHGRVWPVIAGFSGIAMMAAALSLGHGALEVPLTVAGVVMMAVAHVLNRRATA